MKAKTVLVAAIAGGVGYVLGTRAGRDRYEQIKARATDLAHSPQAQDAAAKVAAEVKKSTGSLPDPVANVVDPVVHAAADAVVDATKPAEGGTTSTTSA